ncbi:MAG: class I SAM-dependent DNA methyltransferase, partial [Planctomycetaceae bacterium]|nr:class I SAM-dependent DNA methyltransferase [Planctomycetaceae bacterium]
MNHEEFVTRWQRSGGAELANSQSFLKELCQLLELPEPEPTQTDESNNSYVFEKAVSLNNGDGTSSTGRVDLYRQKTFVLESKQGAERRANELAEALATVTKQKKHRKGTAQRGTAQWAQAMRSAYQQAKRYAEALPEWPPFLIICDVGYCFDIYADFSGTGKNYSPFPDPVSFRIPLQDLTREDKQKFLKAIWLEPHNLDPSKISARVTRELADRLAKLARSLEHGTATEDADHSAHSVAQFLMRCLFTMFAEDVELIPKRAFLGLLESLRETPEQFAPMLEALWQNMDKGGFSPILRTKLKQFNGGLFADCSAMPLNRDQLELLIEAAKANWAEVEPAIFGTLLERALDPRERHKLGAHYTPRAYVERLVMPTVIEPLREEWDNVYATAVALYEADKVADARKTVREFREKLCHLHILDPACGSGNFLYVTLELLKRLEGEVTRAMIDFGEQQKTLGITIGPEQFLGLEVNPRAAAIADLVLWIGYLQWHIRALGKETIAEPIIRRIQNIECRDAVLAWDSIEPVADEDGKPVTRWDGHTTKRHPVTGDEVPDETARVQELRYINPRKAEWPQADYIVGNPPFIGKLFQLTALGEGYVAALRRAYDDEVDGSSDFVMYWWHIAAELASSRQTQRFGLITTNSIRQTFNRRTVENHLSNSLPVLLRFTSPDHPWVDTAMCAAVRISMTVGEAGTGPGRLLTIVSENPGADGAAEVQFREEFGIVSSMLRIGADIAGTASLLANAGLASMGPALGSRGFVVDRERREMLIANDGPNIDRLIKPLRNGRDLLSEPRNLFAIDLHGIENEDELRRLYPATYQHLYDRVRPERIENRDARLRTYWWLFRRSNETFRAMLRGLSQSIVTVETAKYRLFFVCGASILAEHGTISFGLSDPFFLGVLSSRAHVVWALANGGTLEDRPRYNKTVCFDTFAFPYLSTDSRPQILNLAEQLDAHRKRQQELHPDLTMTGMYNVLEKLRSGEELTPKEKAIHEKGLVSVLKQIHDDLDAAVFDAYGWPHDL